MDLSTNGIQSYQRHQNTLDFVQPMQGTSATTADNPDASENETDSVKISNSAKLFNWVAHHFPLSSDNAATISQASQTLYSYHIFDFNDVSTVNNLLAQTPDLPILDSLDSQLQKTTSYQEKRTLEHIVQVFLTLSAAETLLTT